MDAATVQALADRTAILDCLTRYCRGVDRGDRDLILSAYHPDAIDDHGEFVGSPAQFVEWSFARDPSETTVKHHCLTNHTCEIDGDTAHAETYYTYYTRNPDGNVMTAGGRYIDRLERREGEWRIATRYCVVEWGGAIAGGPVPFADIPDVHASGTPSRSRKDPSYTRPLINKRQPRFVRAG